MFGLADIIGEGSIGYMYLVSAHKASDMQALGSGFA